MPDCIECGYPIAPENDRKIAGQRVCYVCDEMFLAICQMRWFLRAQEEWEKERDRKRKIMGND